MQQMTISISENLTSQILIEEEISNKIQDFFEDKKYFLITNTTLAKLYPQFIYKFDKNRTIIIKDGEKYKNINTYNLIIEKLLEQKIERKDCIVAFGGGVIGDLAGYCASTILRGVELIQVPTTLLAMCDSSIGGKTGFNTKQGKNLIGSFYLAKKVIIDPLLLNTLNNYEYKCGLGEVIKYAIIEKSCEHPKDFNLMNFLITNQTQDVKKEMPYIINACANLKARVVSLDKNEKGLRKILNFGHTFAHPIETLSNYKKYSHGQAVAYGMKFATKLSYNLNKINKEYCNQIIQLIDKFELANKKIKYKPSKIVELMKQDKKVQNEKINLLLPSGERLVELFDNIDLPSIEASML